MKKFLTVFVLFFPLFLSSCSEGADELGKNSIVTTVFADFKNNSYVFYAENLSFSSYSNEKKESSALVYSQGNTPFKAWENLKKNFSGEPYFGHTGAVVMGEGFMEKGCREILLFLINESSLPTNVAVFFTKSSPESFRAFSISEAIEEKSVPLQASYKAFYPENTVFDIPLIEEKNKLPKCSSTVILKDFSCDCILSDTDFDTYSVLKNRGYGKIYDDFEISFSKTKIKKDKISIVLSLNFISPESGENAKNLIKSNAEKFVNRLSRKNRLYILSDKLDKNAKISVTATQKRISRLKNGGRK